MKVLHLIDSGGLYGAEKMILTLVKAQLLMGHKPMILSAGDLNIKKKPFEIEAKAEQLPIKTWRMKPGLNIKCMVEIVTWANKNGYQIFHSHGFKFNVLLTLCARWIGHAQVVSTVHGYINARPFSKLWLYQLMDRYAIRRMKRVALVTSSMKGMPARLIDSERISVIPNGLDVNVIQKLSGLNLSEPFNSFIKNHDPVILAVGRLAEEKRFNCVINALKVIKRKNITAGVIIVGEGGLRDSLNELVNSLGLEGDVLMPGYTKHVPALLRHCDFLLMPSKTEGLPITLLEAIAVKIPVISTPVGEIPVVLGHGKGGWIINDADAVTIASTVNELAENPDICIAKAKWAYENLLEFYSAKRMAENYDLFYKKALDQA